MTNKTQPHPQENLCLICGKPLTLKCPCSQRITKKTQDRERTLLLKNLTDQQRQWTRDDWLASFERFREDHGLPPAAGRAAPPPKLPK